MSNLLVAYRRFQIQATSFLRECKANPILTVLAIGFWLLVASWIYSAIFPPSKELPNIDPYRVVRGTYRLQEKVAARDPNWRRTVIKNADGSYTMATDDGIYVVRPKR